MGATRRDCVSLCAQQSLGKATIIAGNGTSDNNARLKCRIKAPIDTAKLIYLIITHFASKTH